MRRETQGREHRLITRLLPEVSRTIIRQAQTVKSSPEVHITTTQGRRMSAAANEHVWIGLAELRQRAGAGVLLDRNNAFTNVLALAQNVDGFRDAVARALAEEGFDLVDLEDAEPLHLRLMTHSVDEELLKLASEVQRTGQPLFGRLHTWISDD
jgi:hypothetical protein